MTICGVEMIPHFCFENCYELATVRLGKSLTAIDSGAFGNGTSVTDVYYEGTKTQWNKITIGEYNENLTNAAIHYNASLN